MRRPIGERGERLKPKVYARLLPSGGQGLHRHIRTGEADVPAVRFPTDRDRLGRSLNRAGPAHGDAPNLGQDQEAVVQASRHCRTACR